MSIKELIEMIIGLGAFCWVIHMVISYLSKDREDEHR